MFVHSFRSAELNGYVIRIYVENSHTFFQEGLDADESSRRVFYFTIVVAGRRNAHNWHSGFDRFSVHFVDRVVAKSNTGFFQEHRLHPFDAAMVEAWVHDNWGKLEKLFDSSPFRPEYIKVEPVFDMENYNPLE